MIIVNLSALETAYDHLMSTGFYDRILRQYIDTLKRAKKLLIQNVCNHGLRGSFDDWKLFKNETWYMEAEIIMNNIPWGNIWENNRWERVDSAHLIGDLVCARGFNELANFYNLLKKLKQNA